MYNKMLGIRHQSIPSNTKGYTMVPMRWNPDVIRPKLGALGRYIPLETFATWYPMVSTLAADLETYEPDRNELHASTKEENVNIQRRAFVEAYKTVKNLGNAYHNEEPFSHFFEAQIELIDTYQKMTGNKFPDAVMQAFFFAGLMHDSGHCGATFRSQASQKEKLFLPELGENVSSEYVSMVSADKLAKELGFSVPARLFISFLIAATTYGGNTEEGKRLKIDHIKVTGFFGTAMRLCDVAPPHSITEAARRDNGVNIAEIPASGKPETLKKQIEARIGFLGYIQLLMQTMDDMVDCELTEELGWQQRVRVELDDLSSDNNSPRSLLVKVLFGGHREIARG
jgi:hypothetical protein